jgi:hypothetical protein
MNEASSSHTHYEVMIDRKEPGRSSFKYIDLLV